MIPRRARFLLAFPLLATLLLGVPWAGPARAGALYQIDQRYGTVGFAVSVLGLFDVKGRFARFDGELNLDLQRPELSSVRVELDTPSVDMPQPDQAELLRSPAYFDVERFPRARFASQAITPLSPTRYRITGTVEIRGVTQPLLLEANLLNRHTDTARGMEVADLVITGEVLRSGFGMVADRPALSDRVQLDIRIHLAVPADAR
ncbi:YceI family protein [Roseomonas sp. GC11]|uniref:YceI family protein n=1 Tax=Roseomonas sp. GC11 TaxID=2950546 RepID=UPI00210C18F4|nr:YceI family protein [Roseomonas sp. GC11]MCQ4160655.1 YceI family protein [Roseomonas sp. GC11]